MLSKIANRIKENAGYGIVPLIGGKTMFEHWKLKVKDNSCSCDFVLIPETTEQQIKLYQAEDIKNE